MSDLADFYIPRTLDAPPRLLLWSVDEAMLFALPFGFGMIFSHILIGFIVGCVLFTTWRRIKGKRKSKVIMHMAYWYLPSSLFKLKRMPPSHNRMFLN